MAGGPAAWLLLFCCLHECIFHAAGARTSAEEAQGDEDDLSREEDVLDLDVGVAASKVNNFDRKTCIRQDNLDIVLPSSKDFVLRKVIPTSADSIHKDIYVSATGIQIQRFAAILTVQRINREQFEFSLSGDRVYNKHEDVLEVDFALSGLDILTASTSLDWATSLLADRTEMRKKQGGKLWFKFFGRGEAVWNETTVQWEVKLKESSVKPFHVELTSHWLLTKAISKYGGIDKILEQSIPPLFEQVLPAHLGAIFHYVPMDELWYQVSAVVKGSMPEVNGLLTLETQVMAKIDVSLPKVLEAFLEVYDVDKLVERKVANILGKRELKRLWKKKKSLFVQTMVRYGLVLGQDFLTKAKETDDLKELRPALTEAAKKAVNKLLLNMQPLLEAYKAGEREIFQGMRVNSRVNAAWSKDKDNGEITGSVMDAESKPWVLPASLLRLMKVDEKLVRPDNVGSMVALEGCHVAGNEIRMGKARLVQMLANASNATWRLDGQLIEFSIDMPTPVLAASSVEVPYISLGYSTEGDLRLDIGEEGVRFQIGEAPQGDTKQNPEEEWLLDLRDGAEGTLDGALPDSYARPTQAVPTMSRKELLPTFDLDLSFAATGMDKKVHTTVGMSLTTHVEVLQAATVALAPRPREDFGYTFASGKFIWARQFEKGTRKELKDEVVAVVSCGFVRIYTLKAKLLDNLEFKPKDEGGQLELDLGTYTGQLSMHTSKTGKHCVDLATQGQKPRKVSDGIFSSDLVHDELCADKATTTRFTKAMNLQIKRFRADSTKTKEWNHGTHEWETPMYVLPSGKATQDLTSIIRKRQSGPSALLSDVANESEEAVHQPPEVGEDEPSIEAALPTEDNMAEIRQPGMLVDLEKDQEAVLEEDEEISADRKLCFAWDALDMLYFPPKKENSQILRKALPDIPSVGDVFLQLDDLFITDVNLRLTVGRKTDDTFSFELTGNGQEMGSVHTYLEGLEFVTPQSTWAGGLVSFVKGVAAVEHFVSKLLPFTSDNYGRLDTGPMDVKFHIKGNFKHDGKNWTIVQDSVTQKVDVSFGAGGLIQTVLNTIINSMGGIDKIFFDNVWPLVQKAIPPTLGAAFHAVPEKSGDIEYALTVNAWCPDRKDRRCPSRKLYIKPVAAFETKGAVDVVLGSYAEKMAKEEAPLPKVVENIVKGYKEKGQVFQGSHVKMGVRGGLSDKLTVTANLGMRSELKTSLISILAGGEGSPGQDFLPESGANLGLMAPGIALRDGVAKIPSLSLTNLRLPLATDGGMDAAHVNVSIHGMTLMRVAGGPEASPGEVDPFAARSLVSLDLGDLALQFSRVTGLQLSFNEDNSYWMLNLHKEFLEEKLRPKADEPPLSERTGPETAPFGVVPDLYQRPFSIEPPVMDLREVLLGLNTNSNITLTSKSESSKGSREWIEFGIETMTFVPVFLGKEVLRAAVAGTQMHDLGYMHHTVAGYYGEMDGSKMPSDTALAVLHCGNLEILGLEDTSQPFASSNMLLSMDLRVHLKKHKNKVSSAWNIKPGHRKGWSCLCLGDHEESSFLFFSSTNTLYFCGRTEYVTNLQKGIRLQQTRFQNVAHAFDLKKGRKKSALPDGTWFTDLDPYKPSTLFPMRRRPTNDGQIAAPLDVFKRAQAQMGI